MMWFGILFFQPRITHPLKGYCQVLAKSCQEKPNLDHNSGFVALLETTSVCFPSSLVGFTLKGSH